MSPREIEKQKTNAELMVLDALQNFTKVTGQRIHSIEFEQESPHEDAPKEFKSVKLILEDNNEN